MTINPLLNLSVVAVLYLSWLLYKQAIQVSTRAPGNRGAGIGFRTPDKISLRGPGSGHHRVAHEASIRRKGSQERTRPIRMPPARYWRTWRSWSTTSHLWFARSEASSATSAKGWTSDACNEWQRSFRHLVRFVRIRSSEKSFSTIADCQLFLTRFWF